MGTPQKNMGQSLESPYARHMQQYPSQSDTFMPNEFGGKSCGPASTPSKQHFQGNNYHSSSNNSRRGGGNRYFNAHRGQNAGGNNGGYRNNYQNNFQSNYGYQQQASRYSNSGNRQQPYHGQRYNKSEVSPRNDYYHPTMLEDPWKDLLDRHNAIKNSQINILPETTTIEEERELSSPESESSTQEEAIPSPITAETSTNNISP